MTKTIEEILSDDELGPLVKAFVDKRVGQGIQTALSKRLDTSVLTQRLARLEDATKQMQVKNDLKFYVFKKSHDANVSYDLVKDIPFTSTEEASKKINAISEFAKQKASEDFNNMVVNSSIKPGSGNSGSEKVMRIFDDYVKEFSIEKG